MTQQSDLCDAFEHNSDGSWTSVKVVAISSPNRGQIHIWPGMTFSSGGDFMGVDVAAFLDQNCA